MRCLTDVQYVCSRFNFRVTLDDSDGAFLFNCLRASLIKLPRDIDLLLGSITDEKPLHVDDHSREDGFLHALLEGGFVVPKGFDELKVIEDRFCNPSPGKILALTIAPTLDCNLACYYCYQKRDRARMRREMCDRIALEVERRLSHEHHQKLLVDWYGGEPLLASDTVEYLSRELMSLTSGMQIEYASTMVTNGTLLTERAVDTLSDLGIGNIQITLDGPPSIHNRNRPFRSGKPSFDAVLDGIKTASTRFDLSIRINVDRDTINEAYRILDILEDNDVFSNDKKILPYIAMIGPLSSTCSDSVRRTIPVVDFYGYVLDFQKEVLRRIPNLEAEDVFEIPRVLYRACGAQNPDSICIHPSGQVFKCGIEIHDPTLGASLFWEDYSVHRNWRKWMNLNPLESGECASCIFLPLCMGGCAMYKYGHFYERESCIHWNTYLKSILKHIIESKREEMDESATGNT